MSAENSKQSIAISVAERIAREFAFLPQVEAIAIAGSRASEFADAESDVDLYVYVTEDIGLDERTRIAAGSPRAEIGQHNMGAG
jgi:predicted nucleotidyltransferase